MKSLSRATSLSSWTPAFKLTKAFISWAVNVVQLPVETIDVFFFSKTNSSSKYNSNAPSIVDSYWRAAWTVNLYAAFSGTFIL